MVILNLWRIAQLYSYVKIWLYKFNFQVLKAEHRNLTEQHQLVVKQNEATSSQLQDMKVVKENLSTTLQEKLADVERLAQEKDTYFKLLGEKEKVLDNCQIYCVF